jgi:hypothetical protein
MTHTSSTFAVAVAGAVDSTSAFRLVADDKANLFGGGGSRILDTW